MYFTKCIEDSTYKFELVCAILSQYISAMLHNIL